MEYKFDKKVSENANGGYLMGMEIVPDKNDEDEKEKCNKNNKKIKYIEKREKGNVSTEIEKKIDINELHENWGIRKKKLQN